MPAEQQAGTTRDIERGVLYVVTGGRRFSDAAEASARSLRKVMPGLPIAVASDLEISIPTAVRIPMPETDGFRAKILAMQRSPFRATLMLDVDTRVIGNLEDVFQLLETFDMALAHAPNRVTMEIEGVPASFPEFNTGVIAYRSNSVVEKALADWLDVYDQFSAFNPPSKDQPSFRRVAFDSHDLRIATLTPDFNQRVNMAGYQNQRVRILHGWLEEGADYESIAKVMNQRVTESGYRAVFAGSRLFDGRGRLVADWGPSRKLRGFRTFILRHL